MTTTTTEAAVAAAKDILRTLITEAAEAGQRERERLGRDLTEAEANELAAMMERQFRLAMAVAR